MRTVSHEERAALVRYLLGELPELEREQIDERCLFDEDYADVFDELETDLVDAYVESTLTPLQRQHFETRYLVTQQRRAAVQAAYLAKVYRDRGASPIGATNKRPETNALVLLLQGTRLTPLLAGLAFAVISVGVWAVWGVAGRDQRQVVIGVGNREREANEPKSDFQAPVAKTKPQTLATASTANKNAAHRDGEQSKDRVEESERGNGARADAAKLGSPAPTGIVHDGSGRDGEVAVGQLPMLVANNTASDLVAIEEALQKRYALTTDGVAQPGVTLTLRKGYLMASEGIPYPNIYRDGNIKRLDVLNNLGSKVDARKVTKGESVRLTGIEVTEGGILFDLSIDAATNVDYLATIAFPFERGSPPTVSQALAMTAQIFEADRDEDLTRANSLAAGNLPRGSPTTDSALPSPTMTHSAPLAATSIRRSRNSGGTVSTFSPIQISLGEPVEEVVAALGEPSKILIFSTKKVYIYPDLRIIFVDGRLSDVQ